MPSKPKQKMPIEERAKQFMPFSALKGLEEALASKEKIIVPKKELTQDYAEELNLKLKSWFYYNSCLLLQRGIYQTYRYDC